MATATSSPFSTSDRAGAAARKKSIASLSLSFVNVLFEGRYERRGSGGREGGSGATPEKKLMPMREREQAFRNCVATMLASKDVVVLIEWPARRKLEDDVWPVHKLILGDEESFTDTIAFAYNVQSLGRVGPVVTARWKNDMSRKMLAAQTFQHIATGFEFTVVAVHVPSPTTEVTAADRCQEIAEFVKHFETPILCGDFNMGSGHRPVAQKALAPLIELSETIGPTCGGGKVQFDYCFAPIALAKHVTGMTKYPREPWRLINYGGGDGKGDEAQPYRDYFSDHCVVSVSWSGNEWYKTSLLSTLRQQRRRFEDPLFPLALSTSAQEPGAAPLPPPDPIEHVPPPFKKAPAPKQQVAAVFSVPPPLVQQQHQSPPAQAQKVQLPAEVEWNAQTNPTPSMMRRKQPQGHATAKGTSPFPSSFSMAFVNILHDANYTSSGDLWCQKMPEEERHASFQRYCADVLSKKDVVGFVEWGADQQELDTNLWPEHDLLLGDCTSKKDTLAVAFNALRISPTSGAVAKRWENSRASSTRMMLAQPFKYIAFDFEFTFVLCQFPPASSEEEAKRRCSELKDFCAQFVNAIVCGDFDLEIKRFQSKVVHPCLAPLVDVTQRLEALPTCALREGGVGRVDYCFAPPLFAQHVSSVQAFPSESWALVKFQTGNNAEELPFLDYFSNHSIIAVEWNLVTDRQWCKQVFRVGDPVPITSRSLAVGHLHTEDRSNEPEKREKKEEFIPWQPAPLHTEEGKHQQRPGEKKRAAATTLGSKQEMKFCFVNLLSEARYQQEAKGEAMPQEHRKRALAKAVAETMASHEVVALLEWDPKETMLDSAVWKTHRLIVADKYSTSDTIAIVYNGEELETVGRCETSKWWSDFSSRLLVAQKFRHVATKFEFTFIALHCPFVPDAKTAANRLGEMKKFALNHTTPIVCGDFSFSRAQHKFPQGLLFPLIEITSSIGATSAQLEGPGETDLCFVHNVLAPAIETVRKEPSDLWRLINFAPTGGGVGFMDYFSNHCIVSVSCNIMTALAKLEEEEDFTFDDSHLNRKGVTAAAAAAAPIVGLEGNELGSFDDSVLARGRESVRGPVPGLSVAFSNVMSVARFLKLKSTPQQQEEVGSCDAQLRRKREIFNNYVCSTLRDQMIAALLEWDPKETMLDSAVWPKTHRLIVADKYSTSDTIAIVYNGEELETVGRCETSKWWSDFSSRLLVAQKFRHVATKFEFTFIALHCPFVPDAKTAANRLGEVKKFAANYSTPIVCGDFNLSPSIRFTGGETVNMFPLLQIHDNFFVHACFAASNIAGTGGGAAAAAGVCSVELLPREPSALICEEQQEVEFFSDTPIIVVRW